MHLTILLSGILKGLRRKRVTEQTPTTVDLEWNREGVASHRAGDIIPGNHPCAYVAGRTVLPLQSLYTSPPRPTASEEEYMQHQRIRRKIRYDRKMMPKVNQGKPDQPNQIQSKPNQITRQINLTERGRRSRRSNRRQTGPAGAKQGRTESEAAGVPHLAVAVHQQWRRWYSL